MTVLELSYYQDSSNTIYCVREETNQTVTKEAIEDWIFGNIKNVVALKWQGRAKVDFNKHLKVHLKVDNGTNTMHYYYRCRKTKSDIEKQFTIASEGNFVIEDYSMFSKPGGMSMHNITNFIRYQSEPKNVHKGPERPNPFSQ